MAHSPDNHIYTLLQHPRTYHEEAFTVTNKWIRAVLRCLSLSFKSFFYYDELSFLFWVAPKEGLVKFDVFIHLKWLPFLLVYRSLPVWIVPTARCFSRSVALSKFLMISSTCTVATTIITTSATTISTVDCYCQHEPLAQCLCMLMMMIYSGFCQSVSLKYSQFQRPSYLQLSQTSLLVLTGAGSMLSMLCFLPVCASMSELNAWVFNIP